MLVDFILGTPGALLMVASGVLGLLALGITFIVVLITLLSGNPRKAAGWYLKVVAGGMSPLAVAIFVFILRASLASSSSVHNETGVSPEPAQTALPTIAIQEEAPRAARVPISEFTRVAKEFLSLISTYTPETAKQNFDRASQLIDPPNRDLVAKELSIELSLIEASQRSKQFTWIDEGIEVRGYDGSKAEILFPGIEQKSVGFQELPPEPRNYILRLLATTPEARISVTSWRSEKLGNL